MKEKLFELICQKREFIKKLQMEIDVLLFTYHSMPNEENAKENQKLAYEELMKIDVSDTSMRPMSFLKIERDIRYLENVQRMKNIEDMDKKYDEA